MTAHDARLAEERAEWRALRPHLPVPYWFTGSCGCGDITEHSREEGGDIVTRPIRWCAEGRRIRLWDEP